MQILSMRCIAVLWVAAVLADDSLYSLAFKTLESTKTGHIQTQPQSKWESLMNILFSDKALLSGSNQKDHIPNWERFTEIPVINIKDTAIDKKDKALKLLHHAAYSENDTQAMALLGDIFLFKKYSIARNATLAFSHYFALADTGATRGNSMIGIMYATGIGVPRDYIKALVFLNLAALDRDSQALQVLGYWHLQGITVSKSCTESLKFYRQLADKVVEIYRSSPNERKRLPHDFVAHSDNFGGIYGKDSGGSGNPAASKKELKISDKDLLTIHQVQADGGDAVSQFLTARYFYEGSRSIKVDLKKALHYFGLAAKQHPGLEASKEKGASTFIKHAATAASESHGYLGDMYFRGEGVEQNLEFARKWYERGAALENGASLNGMGVMHMKGLGGLEKNSDLALKYLKESAAKENAEGLVNLALFYMGYIL
jgi:SEL1 protein